ncbi:MAG TPA: dihydrolipoamide acetyltransferase family protein [Bryobacteraceae bacterium]|nr:dihydrolipoamide acetyltransferase family protein [Bryobacteraceae bacterium]
MGEFRMPSLGADMTEGTLVQWNVKPGDSVKRGDIIAVVGTEKADIEVEVYETGTIEKLIAQAGDKLPVGAPLALIRIEGEAVTVAAEAPEPRPAARVHASPMAKKLAQEFGLDLAKIKGTGPGGVIERHDVEEAARAMGAPPPSPPAAAAAAEARTGVSPLRAIAGMRHAIALAMARSNRDIPHYYLSTQIDMSQALNWLEKFNQPRTIEHRVLPAALLLKAVAQALVQVPELNGFWTDDQLKVSADVHLGVAISIRGGGLMIPAILSARKKSVEELMGALRDLITRARSGLLRGSEITEGTITVTNLGDLGVETVYGMIYPPQVALVGFGKITERPWAEHGMLGARPVLTATLAADHRATDGHRGAQFLQALDHLLQEPEKL